MYPLGDKSGDIHVESGGSHEYLNITRPTQTFVALRAVRRHIYEIAFLTPQNVMLKLIEHWIGTFKPACLLDVRMQHNAGDRVAGDIARVPLNFYIPKAVKREFRLPNFLTASFEGVIIRRVGSTQIGDV